MPTTAPPYPNPATALLYALLCVALFAAQPARAQVETFLMGAGGGQTHPELSSNFRAALDVSGSGRIPGQRIDLYRGDIFVTSGVTGEPWGDVVLTHPPLPVGRYRLTARFAGTTAYAPSQIDFDLDVVDEPIATRVQMSGPASGVADIQRLRFLVGVSAGPGTPAGTVVLRAGGREIGRGTLAPEGAPETYLYPYGYAEILSHPLPTGQHVVTAEYLGEQMFLPNVSENSVTVNVAPGLINTRSELIAPSLVLIGDEVRLEARVTAEGAQPDGGTLTFAADGEDIETVPVDAQGVARLTVTPPEPGTYNIQALYHGSATFRPSASDLVQVVVVETGARATTTTVSGPTSGQQGATLTFTAQVSPTSGGGTPTGTVSFRRGGTQFATASLSGGSASVTTSALPVGTHQITAQYQGTAAFAASTSAARTVTITAVAVDPVQFFGGGSVFGFSDACRPAWSRASEAVRARYSPSELNGGPPSELAIVWPTGSEHVSLWGNMLPSGQFRGGTGRQMWSYFVFYPLRPLVRVVQRQVTQPLNASLANAQELVLRLRVQNFGAIPGCTAVVAVTLRRAG